MPQDWLLRPYFEISFHSVAQACPELLCISDPPVLAFKVVGTMGVHYRAWQTLTFLPPYPQLLAMHVSKKGQAEVELTPYHWISAERKPLQSFFN